ncbi:MAG: D-alanine--D-alanine ligase [Prevotellaceae bacterium]|jgi:D-alanine-D-alanine ligase|nr:D-alanine--D-alanine ligase [Prevotellaceae bacterium]
MKPNVAIVAGGDSKENEISLKSAAGLYSFIDSRRYKLFIVKITGTEWTVQLDKDTHLPIDKNDFSFTCNGMKTVFDFAYITIHGTPGENGILQGYFELLHIPYSTGGALTSALTFNKFACNKFLSAYSIDVPHSILLKKSSDNNIDLAKSMVASHPCFVKPASSGSSVGITKVKTPETLQPAIQKAFAESDEVIVETGIEGIEVTCGMYSVGKKTVVFPVTEVVTKNDFFDFNAKYKGEVEEITPARLSKELTKKIQNLTEKIYFLLDCKGIVRIDYIISNRDDKIYTIEVNTTPGMTETSFIPQQVHAAGLNITDILTEIIENQINK